MSLLKRFHAEVILGGAEACLPRNLSDEWLDLLIEAIDDTLESAETDVPARLERRAITVAVVIPLLRVKYATEREAVIPWEKVHEHLQEYRIELNLELVHRLTEIKCEPATLDTIFTKRGVITWREP